MTPRQNITKETDILTFGKFKGKSIQYVLIEEASYICWLYENDIVSFIDAEDIAIKAEQLAEEQHHEYLRQNYEDDRPD